MVATTSDREPTVNVRLELKTWKRIKVMAAKRGIRGSHMVNLLVKEAQ